MPDTLPLFQVDAFSDRLFGGNPAAVVLLDGPLPTATLQAIAAENNLSETAFVQQRAAGEYDIRWFTPTVEVDLCGHATLAAAWVLQHHCGERSSELVFHSASGALPVTREGEQLWLDFPARTAGHCALPTEDLLAALGLERAVAICQARDTLVEVDDASVVAGLEPDMAALAALDTFAVVVTAPASDCDFVSRFFAPAQGIDEDPVTGSAHCTLVPYWADRLGLDTLEARQLSRRGGLLQTRLVGDRVLLSGHCVLYLKGELHYPNQTGSPDQ